MGGMKNDTELDAWKLAMTMVETAYQVTEAFPVKEKFGLISQIRKCSVSIPSNIAEGQARGTTRVGLYFLRVAIGSTAELATQVELARRLNFVSAEATRELDDELDRVRQMLYGMQREHLRRLGTAAAAIVSLFVLLGASRFFA